MKYPFADRAAQDDRLAAQGALFDPLTRRLLQQAMRRPLAAQAAGRGTFTCP